MDHFKLVSEYAPAGDQPAAIEALVEGLKRGNQFQAFLGVTGSGKTFTMANIIQALNKPALVIAHNKTLAGQLYGEFKEFFPENAVEYSVFWHVYVLIILNIELRCIAKYNIWYADRLLILKWTVWNRHNGEQNSWREEIEKKFWGIYNNIKGYVKWTLIMGGS